MKLYDNAASANGHKVRLLLHQLGLPYELIELDIFSGAAATPEMRAKNVAAQIPFLEVEQGSIVESNAILVHLARGTRFFPDDAWAQTQVLRWMFFEQNQVECSLGSARYWKLTGRREGRMAEWESLVAKGRRALEVMERHLSSRRFFVDERYTIADIALHAYVHIAPDTDVPLEAFPAVSRWVAAVESQPGYIAGPSPYPPSARVQG